MDKVRLLIHSNHRLMLRRLQKSVHQECRGSESCRAITKLYPHY